MLSKSMSQLGGSLLKNRSLMTTMLPQRSYQPVLNSLSKNVVAAEYAVRGQIPIRGEEIMKVINKDGH